MTAGGLQKLKRPSTELSDIKAMTPTHVRLLSALPNSQVEQEQ